MVNACPTLIARPNGVSDLMRYELGVQLQALCALNLFSSTKNIYHIPNTSPLVVSSVIDPYHSAFSMTDSFEISVFCRIKCIILARGWNSVVFLRPWVSQGRLPRAWPQCGQAGYWFSAVSSALGLAWGGENSWDGLIRDRYSKWNDIYNFIKYSIRAEQKCGERTSFYHAKFPKLHISVCYPPLG